MAAPHRRVAGIDVHKSSISVCILPPQHKPEGMVRHEKFSTYLRPLRRLRRLLEQCRVTEVVMESTGQYWRPVWNALEGLELILLNPAHVKGLAGRKTDRRDAEWLARLAEREKLQGSYLPPRPVREWRELTRTRVHWLDDANRIKNRISQLCETANIKLGSVASDLFGVSGRRMLAALLEGAHDAGWIADYARGKLRGKRQELALALECTLTGHQRWLLGQMLDQLARVEGEIALMTARIEEQMAAAHGLIERLKTIPGVDAVTAWTLLAEIGTDVAAFPDARRLASWAGLCPGNRESGGKKMSGRTRRGNNYLRRALCQAAWAATRKKGCYLGALYRRIRSRRGHQRAIVAVAHQMLTIVYHLLSEGTIYQELGENYYDLRRREQTARRAIRRLHGMGYRVTVEDCGVPLAPATGSQDSIRPEAAVARRRSRGRPCKCAERGKVCPHGQGPAAQC